ncbi:hypothetical protein Hanom_Chr07g00587011 [Helianthus anomalus]
MKVIKNGRPLNRSASNISLTVDKTLILSLEINKPTIELKSPLLTNLQSMSGEIRVANAIYEGDELIDQR